MKLIGHNMILNGKNRENKSTRRGSKIWKNID